MTRIILFFLAMFLIVPAHAAEFGGVAIPDDLTVQGEDYAQNLLLNGLAMRSKFIIDVYVGALYLPAKVTTAEAVFSVDQPRRSEMHFMRSVGRDSINDAWLEGLEANVPGASAELKAKFQTLAGMMEDVENGDALIFTYLPERGTEVVVKGVVKGTIPGKDFSDGLLSTWIGPKPGPGEKFKAAILGQR